MSMPTIPPWRTLYDRVAPFLALLIFLIALGAGIATYVNDQNDRERDRALDRADRARIDDNARLLSCFDRFATTLAGGLPPVRAASATRDAALVKALDANAEAAGALNVALVKAIRGTVHPEDVQLVVEKLRAYQDANEVLSAANDHLNDVRAQNPYPEAPSTFCDDTASATP